MNGEARLQRGWTNFKTGPRSWVQMIHTRRGNPQNKGSGLVPTPLHAKKGLGNKRNQERGKIAMVKKNKGGKAQHRAGFMGLRVTVMLTLFHEEL